MKHHRQTRLWTLPLLLGLAAFAHAGEGHRVAFVTSVTGTPDLGSWEDAGGATGLAAGDAVCQARAAAAEMANPENFVAWLSDSSDDAYCRVHGLSGKKADDCGQATLPEAAGPWVRTDGYPFGAAIGQLLWPDNVVYAPLRYNEFGEPAVVSMMTATGAEGTLSGDACGDWTSTAADAGDLKGGASTRTSEGWTASFGSFCSLSGALVCMERLPGPALPDFARAGRLAFVTSVAGNGELASWPQADPGTSSIEAGDSICRNLAADAGLDHATSFKAWLSDSATDAIDRFEHDGPWVRPDGVPVAQNKAALVSASLFTAISVTETGDYRADNTWTGTLPDGTHSGISCADWSDGGSTVEGRRGLVHDADGGWTSFFQFSCSLGFRLYCLSDTDLTVFNDRFEQP